MRSSRSAAQARSFRATSQTGSEPEIVREVFGAYERIDILVNNAGITRDRSIRKMTDDDWTEVIDTNLNSAFYCTSAACHP